ncbi:nitroreductase family protein [Lederbergia citri]|uniref:Nitroreductase family protein n=1 Tax=Lederbergia citri TaxID=2833580 RepID=A0A942YGZ6_9BACI|nr:nitroreductase family protein [Lederbergia citri]MBS4196037.1 nitroreductase family protein [Lederbergia citri]
MIETKQNFYSAVENRRSIYGISKDTVITDERIEEIVAQAIKHSPSAYNSQSGRAVILLGQNHDKLWNITEAALREKVSADKFKLTEEKMAAFRNGYGTILFFEDQTVVKGLQEKFPSYAEKMPEYSMQSSGMLQYIVWTALELEGFGVSLQHYNPIIDEAVQQIWDIPENWKLISQMPFGKPTVGPREKQYNSVEDRMIVFK